MPNYFDLTHTDVIARREAAEATNQVLYQYAGDIALAIRVAQATRRPLLLLGEPGCGKSTLARDVALSLGHAYVEDVITSRTSARDLLWRYDHVRRLGDAPIAGNERKVANLRHYVEPGPIWWSIDPDSARRRGGDVFERVAEAVDPAQLNRGSTSGTVLLLDEIDKADPDVPNDLLLALGEYRFEIAEPRTRVAKPEERELLVFLTSNGERDLPAAFLRRCIPLELRRPEGDMLRSIITAHCAADAARYKRTAGLASLIDAVLAVLKQPPSSAGGLRGPGTAEAIDAVRACITENVLGPGEQDEADPRWAAITAMTLWKKVEPTKAKAEPT
jgi:MoxR-like ATPase